MSWQFRFVFWTTSTPVNPDQVLSDDDLPMAVSAEDWRQVIRIRDVPPEVQVVGLSQNGDTRLMTGLWDVWRPFSLLCLLIQCRCILIRL